MLRHPNGIRPNECSRIQRAIEGKVSPTLADREDDPTRVQRLAVWDWIADAFRQLSVARLPLRLDHATVVSLLICS